WCPPSRAMRPLSLATLFALILSLLGGCHPAAPPPPPQPPPKPVCERAPEPGKPVLCQPAESSALFVVGLPAAHNRPRGARVVLEAPYADGQGVQPVALLAVKEAYGDVAEVHVLYQLPGRKLDGLAARPVRDERVRLGKYVGRIEEVQGGRVRLDI